MSIGKTYCKDFSQCENILIHTSVAQESPSIQGIVLCIKYCLVFTTRVFE